jgi:hypothetical protein
MYYGGLIQISEVSHILGHVEFWRVDFVDILATYCPIDAFVIASHLQCIAVVFRNPSFDESEPVILEPYPALSREFREVARGFC